MGTHPIFESDFDCLTDLHVSSAKEIFKKLEEIELNRSIFLQKKILKLFQPKNTQKIQKTKTFGPRREINND